jgi:uncharacterized protein (UPF0264 family)
MTRPITSKLLVSVRSATEARAALAGGADLIDVKEPSRGPLGPADSDVIREVIGTVARRVPVSAALGEWLVWADRPVPQGLEYSKFGMAGLPNLQSCALKSIRRLNYARHSVLVTYADFRRAQSPDPEWLAAAAIRFQFRAFLIDTAFKDGSTLLDWIAPATLARMRFELGDAGVLVALAGSLDESAVRKLAPLAPDWFAVRGAVCVGGRDGTVCVDRVRRLRDVIEDGNRTNAG